MSSPWSLRFQAGGNLAAAGEPGGRIKALVAVLFVYLAIVTLAAGSTSGPVITETVAVSESSKYNFDSWDAGQGFPYTRAAAIVQTRDGYLWIGTSDGVVRFDGVKFTAFTVKTGSLKDDEVWTMYEDQQGALWIGTIGGGVTVYQHGRFTTYTTDDGLQDNTVRKIDGSRDGTVWLATAKGVCSYAQGVFTPYANAQGIASGLFQNVNASSDQGVLAVAGTQLLRLEKGRFEIVQDIVNESDRRFLDLATGRDGSLWIYCEAGVVKKLHGGLVTSYPVENNRGAARGTVFEDPSGTVWLGTRAGLYWLRDGKFRLFSNAGTHSSMGAIFCLCMDQEGSLWMGLEASGLARLRKTQFANLDKNDGLPDNSTRSVFEDHLGNLWIGTALGFAKYSHGAITAYDKLNGAIIPWVTAIGEDKDGNLWVGAGGELLILRNGVLERYPGWKRAFDIKTIYRDPHDRMWVGTDGSGLYLFEDGKVTHFSTSNGLSSDKVRGVLCDRQGTVWIGTFESGLNRYADGRFTNYTVRDGLGSNQVMAVFEDLDGNLWFTTRGGLSRWRQGGFSTYRPTQGLPVDFVSSMIQDLKGNYWFSSNHGIFQVNRSAFDDLDRGRIGKITPVIYTAKDGMKTTAFMASWQPNALRTADGRLLFASLKGVVIVDPANLFPSPKPPPVLIENVRINRREQLIDEAAVIPPGDGEIEIDYTALSYIDSANIRFKYQLEGLDRQWIQADTRRFAHYTHLSPGNYRFRVTASTDGETWSEQDASYAFQLRPYFYQTLWFRLLALLALILGIGAAFQLRVMQHRVRERELKRRVDEALAEVDVLSGLLPICAGCKQIRDDQGYWNKIEDYLGQHSKVQFSHGLCPNCVRKLYPDFSNDILGQSPPPPPKEPSQ